MDKLDMQIARLKAKTTSQDESLVRLSIKKNKNKRYEVTHFPALYGRPTFTNFRFMTWLMAAKRVCFGAIEVRIHDRKTDKYKVF